MARLTCPVCRAWLADVSDESWRVLGKGICTIESVVSRSIDLWADLDLVDKRADEWRVRGTYEPLPPPPDPPLTALALVCECGQRSLFERPVPEET